MIAERMGYEDSVAQFDHQYNEQSSASLEPPDDGSELVAWSTNPNRQGLVTVIQDLHMLSEIDFPLSMPLLPPVSTNPSNCFYTSQSAPLPASSFSTMSDWTGNYKYDETLQPQTSSATNATASARSRHGTKPPGWEGHQHQFNHPRLYISSDNWDRIEVKHGAERHIRRRS